jgi:hypothetical protein
VRAARRQQGRGQLQGVRRHHVVVGEAVDQQQRSLSRWASASNECGRRGRGRFARVAEVPLGVVGVVEPPLGHGSPGDGGVEHVGPAQHGEGGQVATEAPAPDADPDRSSRGSSSARACRASTWSSSTGPARSRCTARSHAEPRPGCHGRRRRPPRSPGRRTTARTGGQPGPAARAGRAVRRRGRAAPGADRHVARPRRSTATPGLVWRRRPGWRGRSRPVLHRCRPHRRPRGPATLRGSPPRRRRRGGAHRHDRPR